MERSVTAVAIWFEPHDNVVWAVSDTRVSGKHGGALTEGAAKILPLSLRCFTAGDEGFFNRPTLSTSFGFAYAGSTLIATMTYAVTNNLLQTLFAFPSQPPPSLLDAAALVGRIAERYVREICDDVEIGVFGWCPLQQHYRAALIHHDPRATPRQMIIVEQPLLQEKFTLVLGTDKALIQEVIGAVYKEFEGQILKRAPKHALQRIIESGTSPEIGGSLQLGVASAHGFTLKSYVTPNALGGIKFSFLGLDIDELGDVGGYRMGMIAIA